MNLDKLKDQRVRNTAIVVAVALIFGAMLWYHYMLSPWTRDGRVRAEVVNIAAQINGQVVELKVLDNQFVHKGDELFVVDPDNYRLALAQAEATVHSAEETMKVRTQESERRAKLGQAISIEETQISATSAAVATADYQQAVALRDVAKLNMDRTVIRSPVNGYVTNLSLRVGDYATSGETKMTIIDSDSYWIAGYFEETKLPRIHEGDYVKVTLMGVGPVVEGHVDSFSRGIADLNAAANGQGLANVDPIFTWVRLAQRIPVRIEIDHVPEGVRLAAGMTCTIVIEPGRKKYQATP